MLKQKIIILSLFALLACVFVSGCTSNGVKTYNESYNGITITFNYPSEYTLNFTENNNNLNKTNDNETSMSMYTLIDNRTLDNIIKQYVQDKTQKITNKLTIVSVENITINGKNATKIIAESPTQNQKFETVTIQLAPGRYINIAGRTTPEKFETEKPNFDMVINSFKLTFS